MLSPFGQRATSSRRHRRRRTASSSAADAVDHREVGDTRRPDKVARDAARLRVRAERRAADAGVAVGAGRGRHPGHPGVETLVAQLELEVLFVRVHHRPEARHRLKRNPMA